jgi:hypothetical protein
VSAAWLQTTSERPPARTHKHPLMS